MTVHTRSDAMRDFAEAIEFYIEEHSPRSARRFKEEVDRVYDEIAADPNRYPPDSKVPDEIRIAFLDFVVCSEILTMLTTALKFQLQKVRANRVTFCALLLVGIAVVWIGYYDSSLVQSIVYLVAMWICSIIIDLYALWKPAQNDFPVRNPGRETIAIVVCIAFFVLFAWIRFFGPVPWEQMMGLPKLLAVSLLIFVYPIAIALFLLLSKYNIKDLGLRVQGLLLAVPVIAVTVIAAYASAPHVTTWNELAAEEGGTINLLLEGFIVAALSEEFFRLVVQTRLGAVLKNVGYGWFIASAIWGLMHAPAWYGKEKDLADALIGSVRIIPLGLMWGYLTHRTKSILPSIFAHGTNIWGLQNF